MNDESEDYIFAHPEIDRIRNMILTVAGRMESFSHIAQNREAWFVALSKKPAKNVAYKGHAIAEVRYLNPVFRQLMIGRGITCPSYCFVFFPRYVQQTENEQWHTVIHEMRHVRPDGKGLIDHYGFGDEEIDSLLNQFLKQAQVPA